MSVEDLDSNGAEIVGCIFNADTESTIKTGRYGSRYGKYGKYGKYGYGKYGSYGKFEVMGNRETDSNE